MLKWVRNRSQQTEFVEGLKEIAGVEKTTQNLRKCLRPSEIIKSDSIVEKISKTMMEQFTRPFQPSFEKEKLYNLVSGRPVSENIWKLIRPLFLAFSRGYTFLNLPISEVGPIDLLLYTRPSVRPLVRSFYRKPVIECFRNLIGH